MKNFPSIDLDTLATVSGGFVVNECATAGLQAGDEAQQSYKGLTSRQRAAVSAVYGNAVAKACRTLEARGISIPQPNIPGLH
jgi:hypothetical protein